MLFKIYSSVAKDMIHVENFYRDGAKNDIECAYSSVMLIPGTNKFKY